MIMWKKYYSDKNVEKIIKKKYINIFSVDFIFNINNRIYSNKQKFMNICDYLKIDFSCYFISFLNCFEITEIQKVFTFTAKNKEILEKYLKSFSNVVLILKNLKVKFYQSCFSFLSGNFFQNQDFLIFYTIYFNFSKSNTNLQITNSSGKSKVFYSAGLVNFKGKQKMLRKLVLVKLFNLLNFLKMKFIKNYPIALHMKNVGSNKFLITKKLKRKFFIKIIKIFELNAYNGCRKKKEKRKRQRKKKRRDG